MDFVGGSCHIATVVVVTKTRFGYQVMFLLLRVPLFFPPSFAVARFDYDATTEGSPFPSSVALHCIIWFTSGSRRSKVK
jgi:hypothetical protein